jgi:hypothetical protein
VVIVNDTNPIWIHCGLPGCVVLTDWAKPIYAHREAPVSGSHCQAGMVAAINPPTTGDTFQAFQACRFLFSASGFSKARPIPSSHFPQAAAEGRPVSSSITSTASNTASNSASSTASHTSSQYGNGAATTVASPSTYFGIVVMVASALLGTIF